MGFQLRFPSILIFQVPTFFQALVAFSLVLFLSLVFHTLLIVLVHPHLHLHFNHHHFNLRQIVSHHLDYCHPILTNLNVRHQTSNPHLMQMDFECRQKFLLRLFRVTVVLHFFCLK